LAGEYTLPFLAPGPYSLAAEAAGFKKFTQTGLQIGTNQKVSKDVLLQVGSQSESVTVTGDVELLQTASASVGQVISSSQIENMPMNGRTALTLAQLAFGVTPSSDPRFTRGLLTMPVHRDFRWVAARASRMSYSWMVRRI